jgi:mRNA-degrading endonuclease toxin of MazEF toxin-antitoxin module
MNYFSLIISTLYKRKLGTLSEEDMKAIANALLVVLTIDHSN